MKGHSVCVRLPRYARNDIVFTQYHQSKTNKNEMIILTAEAGIS
jgi:hypothetical protein